jgi:hypothetical protein
VPTRAGEREREEEEEEFFNHYKNDLKRHAQKPQVEGTTPRPPDACLPAECCWLGKVTSSPSPPKAYRDGGRIPKDGLDITPLPLISH